MGVAERRRKREGSGENMNENEFPFTPQKATTCGKLKLEAEH